MIMFHLCRKFINQKDKAKLVPGVVHVDGSCRLQSVTKEINFNYYKIINEFKKITSIPMI